MSTDGTAEGTGQKGPVVKHGLHEANPDADYWLSRTIEERVAAVEVLRQRMWPGPNGVGSGIARVVRILIKGVVVYDSTRPSEDNERAWRHSSNS